MKELAEGFFKALELIVKFDYSVWEIAGRSLLISSLATILASLISVPLGGLISFYDFFGKRILINIIQTFYSLPPICIGLFVFLMLSRSGPFGAFSLLFTPTGIMIGQMILIIPIIMGLVISGLSGVGKEVKDTALSLGASHYQAILTMMNEARFSIFAAIIMGFGRAISEVGVAMIVGGNIEGFTRVLTTAIALETAKGNISFSLALGMILLGIALFVNISLSKIQATRV